MTAHASRVAAVPGPVLPLLLVAAFLACVWLAVATRDQPPDEPPAAEERPRLRLVRAPFDWERDEDGAA